MKLEDFEKLDKARTPGCWTEEYDTSGYIMAHQKRGGHDIGKITTGGTKADAAFIAACSEMVPKLIKVAKDAAEYAGYAHLPGEPEIAEACARLGSALAELEKP